MDYSDYLVSGGVVVGVYLAAVSLYRVLQNRAQKKRHRLPMDQ